MSVLLPVLPAALDSSDALPLVCEKVSHAYPQRRSMFRSTSSEPVLREISFAVRPGRCLAIVGESGSGKSTLARILLGLERPMSGQVLVHGHPIHELGPRARARMIQPVFQNPAGALNPASSVRDNLLRPFVIHDIDDEALRRQRLSYLLQRVGLEEALLDQHPARLSGGQQQRVALARALMLNPGLLVLDEPTAALDVSVQARVLHVLRELQRDLGLTYVFITHNLPVTAAIADEIAVLHRGQLVELGDCRTVLRSPRHPYTAALLACGLSLKAP